MPDIVVFISQKFKDSDREKIAELMRIREIKTTNDRCNATVVLEPVIYDRQSEDLSIVIATEPTKPVSTLANIADMLVNETRGQIFKLKEDLIMANIPEIIYQSMILPKKSYHRKKTYPKQSLSKFNSINSIRNNKIFNRIKHK